MWCFCTTVTKNETPRRSQETPGDLHFGTSWLHFGTSWLHFETSCFHFGPSWLHQIWERFLVDWSGAENTDLGMYWSSNNSDGIGGARVFKCRKLIEVLCAVQPCCCLKILPLIATSEKGIEGAPSKSMNKSNVTMHALSYLLCN